MKDQAPRAAEQAPKGGCVLWSAELRRAKPSRDAFLSLPRRPITVVLDGIRQNYNLGAIFRLCDAFRVERLIIGGTPVELRKRKLVQAAQGTQRWVPCERVDTALAAIAAAKAAGLWVVVAEQTSVAVPSGDLVPVLPACLVLGSERRGVAQDIVDLADAAVTIPMLGMANSLNVATAAAILLHWLSDCAGRPGSPRLV
jgi:tRNA G18 (ribose-2'-O)-methylase SpoU